MTSAPARGFEDWWSRLPLRLRVTFYFLLVSVPPVLIATFIAAQAISAVFERNVEQWIGEIARFMADETSEGREEAQRAGAIVAAALSSAGPHGEHKSIGPFAELLASVGYDFVSLYTADGRVLFSTGEVEVTQPLPREAMSSVFFAKRDGQRSMMVGAVQEVRVGDEKAFLFVANLLDQAFFTAPHTIRALDLHLIEVSEKGRLFDLAGIGRAAIPVPESVHAALAAGAGLVTEPARSGAAGAVAFAAIRDDHGRLVGIIACRLVGVPALFERLGTFWLFVALAGIAAALSFLVGISMSRRLTAPLRNLTGAVRAVADGDYRIRVREEGGRELEELACGFNAMAAQLQKLREMEAALRHRSQLAALGQAAAVIAHEIRNPLGIIKTSAELVRRKTAMAPAEDRLMGFVLDEVVRIDRLVEELLNFARPAQCSAVPVDLVNETVRPALGFVETEALRRGISLAVRLPDTPVTILGDADQLHQALLNLILNAMEAAGRDGHVIVRVREEEGHVAVEVEDNGPGVPQEVRGTLFDPFVTTRVNGTGLGLATVRSIVEAHQGEVTYADAPEGGAVFTLRFPLPALPLRPRAEAGHGG
ncbi:sensor histidine kinase [Xanthobacter sediminis]|uniref:sensor histidine kinase n=1 Tax=Xanthobacter sediminis TaxID=3119926 RepID=UPI00372C800F